MENELVIFLLCINKNPSLKLKIEFNEEKISVTVSIGVACAIIRNDKINIEKIINEDYKGL
jgi:hypothetical protein